MASSRGPDTRNLLEDVSPLPGIVVSAGSGLGIRLSESSEPQSMSQAVKEPPSAGGANPSPGANREIPGDATAALEEMIDHTTHPLIRQAMDHSVGAHIHPIFHHCRWPGLDIATYVRIRPALVIATRLLESVRTANFLYALVAGPRKEILDHLGHPQKVFSLHEGQDIDQAPHYFAQVEVQHLLQIWLPRTITLHLEGLNGDRGQARPTYDRPVSSESGTCGRHPHCKIMVERKLVDRLIYTTTLEASDHEWIHWEWFFLALTIVHEISHAASMLLENPGKEMFFQDDQFTEMGFALESCIFGGVPERYCSSQDGRWSYILAMPSALLSRRYDEIGKPWRLRSAPEDCLKNQLVNAFIDLSDVQRMIYEPKVSDTYLSPLPWSLLSEGTAAEVEVRKEEVRMGNIWLANDYAQHPISSGE